MKIALAILFISCSLLGHSQAPNYPIIPEYKGPVKSVTTEIYVIDESSTSITQNLHITCQVCDHFEKFDRKGRLIEKQEYIITEPVSDLEMGYCLHLDFDYKKGELITITAREFEQHGMWTDKVDYENSVPKTMYSVTKDGDQTITKYTNTWGSIDEKHYQNGLLIKDSDHTYEYNDKGQKIRSTSIERDTTRNAKIETWEYQNDLLVKYTSMRLGNYFYGTQSEYSYYDTGELFSEKEFNLDGPAETDKKELRTARYYYKDGRDSALRIVNIFSSPEIEKNFTYEYEFHSNGSISSKTQKNEFGDSTEYETFDDRRNLTQRNLYNIYFKLYKTETYTYNDDNELIEKHVQDLYNDEEFSLLYRYDEYGNETHCYREIDGRIFLVQRKIFTYFR